MEVGDQHKLRQTLTALEESMVSGKESHVDLYHRLTRLLTDTRETHTV